MSSIIYKKFQYLCLDYNYELSTILRLYFFYKLKRPALIACLFSIIFVKQLSYEKIIVLTLFQDVGVFVTVVSLVLLPFSYVCLYAL